PSEPGPWVALAQFYLAQKDAQGRPSPRPEQVNDVLARAEKKVDPKKWPAAHAQILEAMGDIDKARAAWDKALNEAPTDGAVLRSVATFRLRNGRPRDAEELLRRLIGNDVQASLDDATWARHQLALLLSTTTDYKDFREALGLVNVRLDDAGALQIDPKEG